MTVSYSMSARGKAAEQPIEEFLEAHFAAPITAIDSVFGFADKCSVYGGRAYHKSELSEADLAWLYSHGIGFRIPLQNTAATVDEFRKESAFLKAHHRAGNSLILAKHRFIEYIRNEFPLYTIEASVVMKIDSMPRVLRNLELFDTVVVDPAWFNAEAPDIPSQHRERIRLFANAGCMYTCPQRICYSAASAANLIYSGDSDCSARTMPRDFKFGMYNFDVKAYIQQGYSKFKLLRSYGHSGY